MKRVMIAVGGVLFGAGLVISGMTDPSRVVGFLDMAGNWDPALAFVMGGAVITFALGLLILRGSAALKAQFKLPDLSADPICKRMVIGSAIFGIGWGIGGFCPGPAIANLASLRPEALVFVPLMLVGMVAAQRLLGLDR
ncbi:MAG: hypothetical protein NWT08_13905 [Akkermansiaceae bacterium]|jgi:uncharacterized protein|nr:hypothetical protein [Akkermansiaceae bacterium]MDP4646068.1 hypothetical protein [Akkermansiaceae bacterium]MDP4720867.1 hypothetical protein [Akkermansiaceae bacterium]MDP4845720.1 hypothetical protein [Akkermansiaceae bacterium]